MKKLALVTGASRGLGKEIALALSQKFKVGVHYFHGLQKAEEILRNIKSIDGEGEVIHGDLRTKEGVERFIKETKDKFGTPDILVNNFGPILVKDLFENCWEDWDFILSANLLAPFLLIKEFVPYMREKGWGRIINIGFSEANKKEAFKKIVPYVISKNALLILTRSVSKLERKHGITCNLISPYILEEGVLPPGENENARIPFQEIISLIKYLCEDRAGNITGRNYVLKVSSK